MSAVEDPLQGAVSSSNPRRDFLALTLAATGVGLAITAILLAAYWQTRQLPYLLSAGLALSLPVAHWVGWALAHRSSRPALGSAVAIGSLVLAVVLPPLLFADYWPIGSLLAVTIPIAAGLAGQSRRVSLFVIVALFTAAAMLAVDLWLAPEARLAPWRMARDGFMLAAGLLVLFLAILALLFWWTQLRQIKFNLAAQLALVFIAISTFSILVIMSILLWQARDTQIRQAGENFKTLAEVNAERAGNALEQQIETLQLLSRENLLITAVSEANAAAVTPDPDALRQRDKTWQTLDRISSEVRRYFSGPAAAELATFRNNNPAFSDLIVTDRLGALVATQGDKPAHFFFGDEPWWKATLKEGQGDIFIGDVAFAPTTRTPRVLIAIPIQSASREQVIGVLAARYDLRLIQRNLELQFAASGAWIDIDLHTPEGMLIASGTTQPTGQAEQVEPLSPTIFEQPASGWFRGVHHGQPAVVAHAPLNTTSGVAYTPFRRISQTELEPATLIPLTRLGWRLIISESEASALAEVPRTARLAALFGLIVMAFVVMAAPAAARVVSRPINALTTTATAIADGDLTQHASPVGPVELVTLAEAFNTLTVRLRASITSLQEQVAQRTAQLQASADVGRTASSVLDPDELVRRTVTLITERFGFYYAAVFLIDATGRQAVLREATGEAGQLLKAQGHRLAVGGQSMVGTVTVARTPRIALDVGKEAIRFANPLLPNTRSEIALPLVVGDQVLGALDVQSTEAAAFDESSAAVLQGMADQLAVALRNAQLFQETSRNLHESSALERFSRAISGAADIQAILSALTEHLLPAGVSEAAILTFEYEARRPSTTLLHLRRIRQVTIAAHRDLRSGGSPLTGTTIAGDRLPFLNSDPLDQPLVVTDINAGPYLDEISRQTYAELGVRALLGVPLVVSGQLQGLIQLTHSEPRSFDPRDIHLLQTAADQAAITLSNIQLLHQTTTALRESSQLYQITSGLSRAITIQEMLEVIVQNAMPAAAEFASLFGYEMANGRVQAIHLLGSRSTGGREAPPRRFSVDEAPGVQVMAAQEGPLVVSDIAADPRFDPASRETYLQENIRSMVAIRLITAGELAGALQVGSRQPATYADDELRVLQAAADQVAIALENRNLLEDAHRRANQQALVNQISTALRAAATREAALQTAVREMGEALNAARAFVWLRSDAGALALAEEISREGIAPFGLDRFPLPDVLEAADQRAVIASENAADHRLAGIPDLQITAHIAVPLLARGESIGVLGLHACGEPRRWMADELALVQEAATQLALSLENIRLVEQLQTSLNEVEELNRVFTRQGWAEYQRTKRAQPLKQVFTPAVEETDGHGATAPTLDLPLSLRGENIGAITLALPPNQTALTADEMALAAAVADQVAISLDNARLIEQTQRRVSELAIINEISQALTSPLDLRSQLKQVGESLLRLFAVPTGYIALYDAETDIIEIPFFAEGDERVSIAPFPLGQGVSSVIIRSRQPLIVNSDAERRLQALGARAVGKPAKSFLGVPVIVGDEVIGVVNVQSTEQEELFTEADVALLTTIAANVGTAIQNTRLFEQTQAALAENTTLYRASRALAEAETPQDILEIIMTYALPKAADRASLLVLHSSTLGEPTEVEWVGFRALQGEYRRMGQRLQVDEVPLWFNLGTEPLVIADVRQAPEVDPVTRSTFERYDVVGICLVPLHTGGRLTGFLAAPSSQPAEFAPKEVRLLRVMADQIAVALEKFRLLAETRRRADQLETAAQVSRASISVLDPDELIVKTVELIRERFDLYYAALFLVDESGRWAMLRYATGEAGRTLMERQHKLEVGGRSMVGTAVSHRQARVALDVGREAVRFANPLLPDTRSEMALPLAVGDTVLGALDVQSIRPNAFSDADVTVLQTMADQVATALQNARLYAAAQQELAERKRAEESLIKFQLGIERSTEAVFITDTQGNILYTNPAFEKTYGFSREEAIGRTPRILKSGLLPAESYKQFWATLLSKSTVAGEIINKTKNGRLINIEGANNPILDEAGNLIGFLSVHRDITERKRAELETQRRSQQLAAANEIGRAATSTLDLDTLLRTSAELIRDRFGLYQASVFIVEPGSNLAVLRESTGEVGQQLKAIRYQLAVGSKSLVGTAMATRQPVIVQDVTQDPDYLVNPLLPDTRAEAVIPLMAGNVVIGALDVQSTIANTFGQGEMAILTTIADQLAVAVQNARLFEKTSRQAQREKLVSEITGKIRAAGDIDQILRTAVAELRRALGVSHGAVRLGLPPRFNDGNGQGDEGNGAGDGNKNS